MAFAALTFAIYRVFTYESGPTRPLKRNALNAFQRPLSDDRAHCQGGCGIGSKSPQAVSSVKFLARLPRGYGEVGFVPGSGHGKGSRILYGAYRYVTGIRLNSAEEQVKAGRWRIRQIGKIVQLSPKVGRILGLFDEYQYYRGRNGSP